MKYEEHKKGEKRNTFINPCIQYNENTHSNSLCFLNSVSSQRHTLIYLYKYISATSLQTTFPWHVSSRARFWIAKVVILV